MIHDMLAIVGALAIAYGLYVVGSFILALLLLPKFLNFFNGRGYIVNAMMLLGFEDWLNRREKAKWEALCRKDWERLAREREAERQLNDSGRV